MIILKEPPKEYRRFVCQVCGCEYAAEKMEVRRLDLSWYASCPYCRNENKAGDGDTWKCEILRFAQDAQR